MKEKELTSKELLVQKLGMEFDEVAPIFSEETLTSMTMSHVVGGAGETNNTTGDDCKSNVKTCETKIGSCGDGSNTNIMPCSGPSTKPTSKPTDSPTDKPTAKPASLL